MFIVYRTTNLITQEFYIGVHKTDDPNDGYLGSGRHLRASILLHGVQNFKRVTLAILQVRQDAYKLERALVEPLLDTPGCLNLHPGGRGGFEYINRKGIHNTKPATEALKNLKVTDPQAFAEKQRRATEARVKSPKFQTAMKALKRDHFLGKCHTHETKQRMSVSHRGKHSGGKNGAYGTMWVLHPEHGPRRIPKADLPLWEAQGWKPGRKALVPKAPRERTKTPCTLCGTPHRLGTYTDPTNPVCKACVARGHYEEARRIFSEGGYTAVATYYGIPYKTAWDWVNASHRMGRVR